MCEQLKDLVDSFGLPEVYDDLCAAKINYNRLQYLSKEDIAEVIKDVGPRAEFREKLFMWKIQNIPNCAQIPYEKSSKKLKSNEKSLAQILASPGGRVIIEFYNKHGKLVNAKRERLVDLILSYIFDNNILLNTADFRTIREEIGEIFPEEKANLDYYFIPRSKTQNSTGRLYKKYFNLKCKKKKEELSTMLETGTLPKSLESNGNSMQN